MFNLTESVLFIALRPALLGEAPEERRGHDSA
jgi:hypothetical protein